MISAEEKKQYVESMINEFQTNEKFRNAITWLIDEMNNTYEKKLQEVKNEIKKL